MLGVDSHPNARLFTTVKLAVYLPGKLIKLVLYPLAVEVHNHGPEPCEVFDAPMEIGGIDHEDHIAVFEV
jgi:hypothetical protein